MKHASAFVCWLALGCDVGGASSAGGGSTEGTGTGAGGGLPACIEIDCSLEENDPDPRCSTIADPGELGDGPPFLGESPQLRRGFLDGQTLFVSFQSGDSDADAAVFSVDTATGLRTFISGVLEDPVSGPQPRGSGPSLRTLWDVTRGPAGTLYALVDNDTGRQVLSIDEISGDRALVVSLATPPCEVGGEAVQVEPQLEVRASTGGILLIGYANGGSGLFEIDPSSGLCTTRSFASDDENRVGTGPTFYDYQTFVPFGEKVYATDEASESLVEIDIPSGNRLRLSSTDAATPVGEGPYSGTQSTLVTGGRSYAARDGSSGSNVLVATDLASGDRIGYLSKGGPVFNPSKLWLYGEEDGCFYVGAAHTVYVFHAESGLSQRLSR